MSAKSNVYTPYCRGMLYTRRIDGPCNTARDWSTPPRLSVFGCATPSPLADISSVVTNAMPLPTWPFYALVPAVVLLHLFVSPYTKVEESFNIQAIHDILIHGIPNANADQFFTANYDHISFPGSVPRTFAGALVLSGLSRPFVALMKSGEQVQLLGMRNKMPTLTRLTKYIQ